LTTLEDAIRKIDLETLELLGTTFRPVNEHFGACSRRFSAAAPRALVMTGDEILDAGVQVMAQPPARRTDSIHLLSGGEKALRRSPSCSRSSSSTRPRSACSTRSTRRSTTANTERYAKLVTRWSEDHPVPVHQPQPHRMEMAEQLIGVTMQEQGVSRIRQPVDMPSAMRLAESGLTAAATAWTP
jgi:chromosome segregation protein